MSSAYMTLKLDPEDFDLVRTALIDYYDTHVDLYRDPVVKEEDKRIAHSEAVRAERLLRAWGWRPQPEMR